MTQRKDIFAPSKSFSPVTPKNCMPLTAAPALASPLTGSDVMIWTDGTRSPTLDTRKGRLTLNKSGELVNLSKPQLRRDDNKKASKVAKQAIRVKKPNPAQLARQARALKAKDITCENGQMVDICSKAKIVATAQTHRSVTEQPLMLSLDADDDEIDEKSDLPSPAMHWKNLFQVHQRQQ